MPSVTPPLTKDISFGAYSAAKFWFILGANAGCIIAQLLEEKRSEPTGERGSPTDPPPQGWAIRTVYYHHGPGPSSENFISSRAIRSWLSNTAPFDP